jgi:hypothetical protein
MFFTWQRIHEITDAYQATAAAALQQGVPFYPHALGFMAGLEGNKNGLHVAVPPVMVADSKGLRTFIHYIAFSLPKQGRIEAAGFISLMPRSVAAEIVNAGRPSGRLHDLVGVLHVEHVYEGVQTWLMGNLLTADWDLVAKGIASNVPSCLPARAYGQTLGSA